MLDPQSQKAVDAELIGRFTQWYCDAHHRDRDRTPLRSEGVTAGIYGDEVPVMCDECTRFTQYAEKRTEHCPHDPKPFCANCLIKCYKQDMRDYSRKVMRYSGPRSLVSRYWLRGIAHVTQTLKYQIGKRLAGN
jgi:hypothetical protein